MGMAASQARFLGLTARKNNVEFEGQQINQQRTTLANQSANYYNDLLGMSVPTPPSVDSFTKTVYTFNDGALTNEITSMIAQPNGNYKVSYLQQWEDDFSVVSAATSVIMQSGSDYMIGNTKLRELTSPFVDVVTTKPTRTGADYTFDGKKDITEIYFSGQDKNTPANTYNYLQLSYDKDTDTYTLIDRKSNQQFDLDDIKIKCDGSTPTYNFMYVSDPGISTTSKVLKLSRSPSGTELSAFNFDDVKYDFEGDQYLPTLSIQQKEELQKEEQQYLALLQKQHPGADFYVRYVQNTTDGTWKPYFYLQSDVTGASWDSNGASTSGIKCYTIGTATRTEEVKGKDAKVEKDATGRYINLTIYEDINDLTTGTQYALTTSTITDQNAYEDAMNQYEFDKAKYDQTINEINAKIEIIQSEDKNLELRLKQLDTEQKAIDNEMEAVKKVIEKNADSSFKTFA